MNPKREQRALRGTLVDWIRSAELLMSCSGVGGALTWLFNQWGQTTQINLPSSDQCRSVCERKNDIYTLVNINRQLCIKSVYTINYHEKVILWMTSDSLLCSIYLNLMRLFPLRRVQTLWNIWALYFSLSLDLSFSHSHSWNTALFCKYLFSHLSATYYYFFHAERVQLLRFCGLPNIFDPLKYSVCDFGKIV